MIDMYIRQQMLTYIMFCTVVVNKASSPLHIVMEY